AGVNRQAVAPRQTDAIRQASIGRRPYHVNPGRGREVEEPGVERQVAALAGQTDARRRAEPIRDARLTDRTVRLVHHQGERADALVLPRHQAHYPALALVGLQAGVEITLEPSEAGEEADRRARLERLPEGRLDHLLLRRLV